jgi:aconitate hydratase
MNALSDNLLVKCVSEIHDPVTTTDELIPSGETSSYRSNPLGLAEFALSRRDPEYVGEAKKVRAVEKDRQIRMDRAEGKSTPESQLDQYGFAKDAGELKGEYETVLDKVEKSFSIAEKDICLGSTIFCTKPGDGSAREQAASCQKVLGAWANIAGEYATKRYRSNLINWGMLPFLYDGQDIHKGDYVFVPDVRKALIDKTDAIKAYVFSSNGNGGFSDAKEVIFSLGSLSDDERQIILDGCLINFYKN